MLLELGRDILVQFPRIEFNVTNRLEGFDKTFDRRCLGREGFAVARTKIHAGVGGELEGKGLTKTVVVNTIRSTANRHGHRLTHELFAIRITPTEPQLETRALELVTNNFDEKITLFVQGDITKKIRMGDVHE